MSQRAVITSRRKEGENNERIGVRRRLEVATIDYRVARKLKYYARVLPYHLLYYSVARGLLAVA